MNFGEHLRFLREERGYSLKKVEMLTGIDNGNLSRYERNLNIPNVEICIQLAKLYGVSLDELVGDDQDYISHPPFVPVATEEKNKNMRLKELREERNMTQKEVAEAVGGTQSNLAKWEKEKIQPAADMVIKLADFFGVSTDYLLGRSDDLGYVTVQSSAPALSEEEEQLLALFRGMDHAQKVRVIAYCEGMKGISVPQWKA